MLDRREFFKALAAPALAAAGVAALPAARKMLVGVDPGGFPAVTTVYLCGTRYSKIDRIAELMKRREPPLIYSWSNHGPEALTRTGWRLLWTDSPCPSSSP